jgi:hypothetical protein
MMHTSNQSSRSLAITEDELRSIIQDSVKQAVEETFIRLGVSVSDPIEMQKDFQHLRDWRLTTASVKTKAMLAATGLLASGLVAAAWMGIQRSLGLK